VTRHRPWLRLYRELIHDPKLRRLPAEQRYVWIVLLCLSDDHGAVEVAPGVGYTVDDLANIAGADPASVEAALQWYRRADMVETLTGGGLRIVHWDDRQYTSDLSTERVRRHRRRRAIQATDDADEGPDSDAGDDTLHGNVSETFHGNVSETPLEQNRTDQIRVEQTPTRARVPPDDTTDPDFDRFWLAYPKRKSKLDARKAWQDTRASRPPIGELLARLQALKASPDWRKDRGKYIPHPATWLRRGGWDDEPEHADDDRYADLEAAAKRSGT